MTTLGREKRTRKNRQSGYDAPLVLHAMGEGALACGTADGALAEQPVLTLHSNCVLSFDVDKPRAKVREYYSAAAETPQVELCCPTKYDADVIAHIPQDVLDRFYGCGSPVTLASVKPGETVVDLGSGAGIDVFVAAKLVGPTGKAIGVDMTDAMLAVANENRPRVAAALGYDVVEFRKGYLEQIPVEDRSVDVITSNCVVNLSPDKPRVFEEMWRILKDNGRIVISDIVSERDVPPHLRVNPELWGECLVGALTQRQFVARLERAGFYGLTVLKKSYWKDVEGYPFFSLTVQGFKYEKTAGCVFKGHRAVYLGPGKAFLDEEGHLFPRNEPYEVCTDTVAKLSQPPYRDMFAILEPGEERAGYACCASDGGVLLTAALVLALMLGVAFANGANDVSKGVATLAGSGLSTERQAIAWGTAWTVAGAFLAVFVARGLMAMFSGDGILSVAPERPAFLAAVSSGAIGWLFFATRTGLPVSTTHALLGGFVGAGIVARASRA
ncbi:MAG: methyltransferase domain-containing protein [Gemmatimonadetes bacterium]|nr:methyltransferase domain-containing protein [Gemmatimonadota bacterium]